jgi:hypothetical protein
MPILTKEEFDLLYDENISKKLYDEIISKIDMRMYEIVKDISIYPNISKFWVDYHNGGKEVNGYFDTHRYREYIFLDGEFTFPDYLNSSYIPTRWLWSDYKSEIKELQEKEEKRKEKAKDSANKRKEKKETLKISIKSKLTPEELKIIKFK